MALGLIFAPVTATALAASFTVNSTTDAVDPNGCATPCTLRDAVKAADAAVGSSTITLPAGTYNLTIPPSGSDDVTTGDLNVTAAITIIGAGASSTIIDGGGGPTTMTDRVFRVESTGSLTLSGATIQHGHPAGGNGTLSEGGGILALGPLTLTDASVTNNFAETPGSTLNGAGAGIAQEGPVTISLTRVNVSGNTVNVSSGQIGGGGGLLLTGGPASAGAVTITDSAISGNLAAGPGGGIYSNPTASGSLTITRTTISGNRAELPPGLSSANHAWGGGLGTDGSIPVTLSGDTINGNKADQSGGGIFDNGSSTYTITNTTVSGNKAVAGCHCGVDFVGGGGIVADGGNTKPGWSLSGDTISGNAAGDGTHPNVPGGGIDEDGGDKFTIVNTTIAGNTASGIGGGYESSGRGSHRLTNVTLGANTAGSGGGNIDNSSQATFTLANAILAAGTPSNCGVSNGSGLPNSLGHNLDSANTCGLGATGDLTNTNPNLGPLGDNGGPTQTEALLPGSPAIDAGDNSLCPAVDQRGAARPQGPACDIGAYERLQSPFVTNANDSGPGSLRAAIALSQPGDTIDFAPSLSGQTITLTSGALTVTHSLSVSGPGGANLTISGNNANTVFDIEANGHTDSVVISGLTITAGAFTGTGTSGGGGIFANSVGALTLTGVTVSHNQATVNRANAGGGGGVYANGGVLTVTNSTITNNTATLTNPSGMTNGGGGIYSDGGVTTVNGSVVSGNTVSESSASSSDSDGGGGIYSDGGAVTVTSSSVDNNTVGIDATQSSSGGGGIYSAGGNVILNGDTVNGNTFTLHGSALGNDGGGGVFSEGGAVTVTSSSIDANSATVTDTSNFGEDGGGGLFSQGGKIDITGSAISGNSANVTATSGNNGGGAIYDEGNHSTYLNSTLSGNAMTITSQGSHNGGGAIWTFGGTAVSDLTIADNTINQAGGAIFNRGPATFLLKDTIVADSSGSPAGNCAGPGSFTSAGFNLESANTCNLTAPGDLTNTEPLLQPLQNNGGSTLTQALPANSPAVDAGSCTDVAGNPVTSDQRGVVRPQPVGGRCDIGAYELIRAPVVPPTNAPPAAVAGTPTAQSSTAATFSGTVNPQGSATDAFFQYGLDPKYTGGGPLVYDHSTPDQPVGSDSSPHTITAQVTGLVPNALYHVRLVATSSAGTSFGPDQTFTTPAGPAPPPPVLGKRETATPVSGLVTVFNGTAFVPLTEATSLPSGTEIDALHGSLKLTAAGAGNRQTGVFGGAIFKLTQTATGELKGLTTLTLIEGAGAGLPTYATCKKHAADATTTALSSRVLQLLHASAHGKFRTRGRYSAATVRGTAWDTADRCDGTLTVVHVHTVTVTDFVKHITIAVHAGQRYLAEAPRSR